MALPDFLVIGAPKAGSTALHAALAQHPDVFVPTPKETKHFLTAGVPPSRAGQRGPGDAHSAQEWVWRREEYEQLFDGAPDAGLRGESTPFYLWDRAAQRRIHATVPGVKLIAVLRDPVDRAYSNWTHLWADGLEPEGDFLTACRLEPERIARGYAPFWRYVELGRYGEQLTHLFELFAREQVLVLRYRQLIEDPAGALDAVCAFLGIAPGIVTSVPGANVSHWAGNAPRDRLLRRAIRTGSWLGSFARPQLWRQASVPLLSALHQRGDERPPLAVAARRELVGWFADDIAITEQLLGWDLQDWLSDSGRGTYAVRKSCDPSEREASQ